MKKPDSDSLKRLNIRIAELMGWAIEGRCVTSPTGGTTTMAETRFPDFTGSLDAVHGALSLIAPTEDEREFQSGRWVEFGRHLERVLEVKEHTMPPFVYVNAEAWQLAVALDRAMSKEPIV